MFFSKVYVDLISVAVLFIQRQSESAGLRGGGSQDAYLVASVFIDTARGRRGSQIKIWDPANGSGGGGYYAGPISPDLAG